MLCTSWQLSHGRCTGLPPLAPPPPRPPFPPFAPGASCDLLLLSANLSCVLPTLLLVLGLLVHVSLPVFWHRIRLGCVLVPAAISLATYLFSLRHFDAAVLAQCEKGTIGIPLTRLLPAMSLMNCTAAVIGTYLAEFSHRGFERRVHVIEGQLLHRLADGTIRLLSLKWLLAQPDAWRLQRRQELPEAAFVTPADAVALLEQGHVAALSCRWLDVDHPDQDGVHLSALRRFLAGRWCVPRRHIEALFWDFASLYQASLHSGGRTEDEEAAFQAGWHAMANLYASPRTLVLQHKSMGGLVCTFPADPHGLAGYDHSGWCVFEQACAALSSWKLCELDAGWVLRPRSLTGHSAEAIRALFTDAAAVKFTQPRDAEHVGAMYVALAERMTALDDYERTVREMKTGDIRGKSGGILVSYEHVRRAARERKQRYDLLLDEQSYATV